MKNPTDGVTVGAVYISPGRFPRLIIGKDCELDVSRLMSCEICRRQPTFCRMTALLLLRGFEM